jgi:hypothetical protein
MKQFFILILCFDLGICCNSQQSHSFSLFLNEFISSEYPIVPIDVFLSLELEMNTKHISETDFNKYLKKLEDTTWIFAENYDYTFGGKFNVNSEIIGVFYRRDYMPDDINKQIGEVILCTFNQKGNLISSVPIAGGYGDTITFSSIIYNSKDIEVSYIE